MIRIVTPPASPHRVTFTTLDSPLGLLTLISEDGILSQVTFPVGRRPDSRPKGAREDDDSLASARQQLEDYFLGSRTGFDLDLAPRGTSFQIEVWKALASIPFGQTRSYGELARVLGRPRASRAVGAANGRNPIPIILPCHRVIGSTGSLTGFGGGLEAKKWLLDHESQRGLF